MPRPVIDSGRRDQTPVNEKRAAPGRDSTSRYVVSMNALPACRPYPCRWDDEHMDARPFDALLLVSFGGPEHPDDVVPFLENVTRGRGIPRERLEEVGQHYYL